MLGGKFLDKEGKDKADDWGHDLTTVSTWLLGLELCIFEEQSLELGILFIYSWLNLLLIELVLLHVDF